MATQDELDDARVTAALGRLLASGAPFDQLPFLNSTTHLFPDPVMGAFDGRYPDAAAVTSLETLVDTGRLSEDELNTTIVSVGGENFAPRHVGTRALAFCGDSNTAAGVTGAGGAGVYNFLVAPLIPTEDNAWVGWAKVAGAGRFHVSAHAATPGITPATWNTEFLDDVIAATPFAAVDALGTNNVENLSQQVAALTAMYDAFDAAGIQVIVCSIPPKTGNVADVQRLNRWKRATAKDRGYLFVDNYAAVVDPATGTMLSGFNSDGTHWNAAGARAVGLAFGAAVASVWPNLVELAVAQPAPADQVDKPLLLALTGGSGFAPADWSNLGNLGSAQITPAVETVTDVAGKMFTIAQSGTGGIDCNASFPLRSNLVAGHRYVLAYRYKLDAVGTPIATVRLEIATGGGTALCATTIRQSLPLGTVAHEFVAPSGLSGYNYRGRVQLNGGSTGTKLWIGQVTLIDLTEAGL